MTLVDDLRMRADGLSSEAQHLEDQILGLERDLAKARRRLEETRESLIETRVGANIIEQHGLRVWTDDKGLPNVAVDEVEPAPPIRSDPSKDEATGEMLRREG